MGILDSQGSVKPALMDNDQLDEYLCKRMHTRDYRIFSLPRAYRPDVEQLRARQLLIITISEVQVERARGEATEDEASEDAAEEDVSDIHADTPVHTGPPGAVRRTPSHQGHAEHSEGTCK